MTPEQTAQLRLIRATLYEHNITVAHRLGQYVLSFFDEAAGLISWRTPSDMAAYKLALDMRDNRKAYVEAKCKRRPRNERPCPLTAFFQQHSSLLEAAA